MEYLLKNIVSQDYLISFEKPEFWRNDVKSGPKKDALRFDSFDEAKKFLEKLNNENIRSFTIKKDKTVEVEI